jgi:hypothetical protein
MTGRLAWMASAAIAAAALAGPVDARAASTAPRPSLSAMALQPSDLPSGAEVTGQGFSSDPGFVAEYARTFVVVDGRVGRSTPLVVDSTVGLTDSAATAAGKLAALRAQLRTAAHRRAFARELAKDLGSPGGVRVGPLRTLHAGATGFAVQASIRLRLGTFQVVEGVVAVDRVLTWLVVVSAPGKRALVADVATLVAAVAGHTRQALLPRATSAPSIAGGAQVGQTLTATPGAWSPATPPTAVAYQWQRCDPTGTVCAPIPGATGQAYAITADDAGATLRVAVVAGNAVGAATAVSPVTAPVA